MLTDPQIDSIETGDAAPAVAPHKISGQPGKDTATITFTPGAEQPESVRAWAIHVGGASPTSGQRIDGAGAICGLALCGRDAPTALPPETQVTRTIERADLGGGADGPRDVAIYSWIEP